MKFRNWGQNEQNTPDSKTMALKPGFSERYFVKCKFWNTNNDKLTQIWYDMIKMWKLGFMISKLRSNDQIIPDSKTMALKSGFSEIDFDENLGFMIEISIKSNMKHLNMILNMNKP